MCLGCVLCPDSYDRTKKSQDKGVIGVEII